MEEIGISKAEQDAAKIIRFRASPTKVTSKPLPIRVSFCAKNPSDLEVEEVLKQAIVILSSLTTVSLTKTWLWHKLFNYRNGIRNKNGDKS